jgi:hypothetical protein
MISVPVYPHDHPLAKYAFETELGDKPGTLRTANGALLKSIPIPRYLNATLSNGVPLADRGIIMSHCYNTCTTVFAYKCKHFDNKEECKYCEIDPVGKGVSGFPDIQDIDEFAEAVAIAQQKENMRSLTITTGTFDENELVVKRYLDLLKKIREKTDVSIHIQFEPVDDLSLIGEIAQYVQSIGIFLEIYDEEIRKQICPGKSRNSREKYKRNWAEAAKRIPKGSVTSACLLGFGEDLQKVAESAEEFAAVGATTAMLFIRSKNEFMSGRIPSYLEAPIDELVDLYLKVAASLKKHDVHYRPIEAAGCAGCQGCSGMVEASEIAELQAGSVS